jgi:hypothetical protein
VRFSDSINVAFFHGNSTCYACYQFKVIPGSNGILRENAVIGKFTRGLREIETGTVTGRVTPELRTGRTCQFDEATTRQQEYATSTRIESPDTTVPAEEHRRKTKV